MRIASLLRWAAFACLLLPACGGSSGDSTATRTPDPNATPTRTRTPRPTRTPGPPVTLYVRPDGNDAHAGTSPTKALRTLGAATKVLSPGSTIHVGSGVYRERLTVTGIAGTAALPVRIVADRSGAQTGGAPGEAVIDADGGLVAAIITNSPWVTIDGFVLRGAAPTETAAAVDLRIRGGSDHVTIKHCIIANADLADGIRVDSSSDVLLFNNLVYAADRGIVITGAANRTQLLNNTIALTDRAGLSLRVSGGAEPADTAVRNSIFQQTGSEVAVDAGGGAGFTGDYNLVFQPTLEDQAAAYDPPAARGGHDVNLDARFVNPPVGDLRLAAGSPAIDAGTNAFDGGLAEELLARTTSADGTPDSAPLDIGYHFPR